MQFFFGRFLRYRNSNCECRESEANHARRHDTRRRRTDAQNGSRHDGRGNERGACKGNRRSAWPEEVRQATVSEDGRARSAQSGPAPRSPLTQTLKASQTPKHHHWRKTAQTGGKRCPTTIQAKADAFADWLPT